MSRCTPPALLLGQPPRHAARRRIARQVSRGTSRLAPHASRSLAYRADQPADRQPRDGMNNIGSGIDISGTGASHSKSPKSATAVSPRAAYGSPQNAHASPHPALAGDALLVEGKQPLPVVLHADDDPAVLLGLVVQCLGETCRPWCRAAPARDRRRIRVSHRRAAPASPAARRRRPWCTPASAGRRASCRTPRRAGDRSSGGCPRACRHRCHSAAAWAPW